MKKLLKWLFFDQGGATLAITTKSSNTLITASGFNTNWSEIEAVVNALEADNISADAVTAVKLNVDCVRANYGLAQHTDGSLFVDVSDTDPGLEVNADGGIRAKVTGMISRESGGIDVGHSGIVLLDVSATAAPTGWTDVSATYSNKFIRINATALSAGGSDTHDHGGATAAHTLTTSEIPAHTHLGPTVHHDGALGGSDYQTSAGGSPRAPSLSTGSAGGGGGHTHNIASADNVPAYVTARMIQKD